MDFLRFLKSKTFLKQVIIAIVSILLLIFFLQWWLGYTTNHKQKIQVPDLQKLTIDEVKQKLEELDLEA